MSSLDVLPTFLAAAGAEAQPLSPPAAHEDAGNRKRCVAKYGAYDGVNLIRVFDQPNAVRSKSLFWRLQGQAAVLNGTTKLIRLSHRPPQLFNTLTDASERNDLILGDRATVLRLYSGTGSLGGRLAHCAVVGIITALDQS